MDDSYSLPVRLRSFRQQAGLTQKKLGEMVGVNESTIRNYELGNRTPDFDTLTVIASVLNISVFSLAIPDLSRVDFATHVLFEMESEYGLTPVMIDNKLYLSIDSKFADMEENSETFQRMLRLWYIAKECRVTEDISEGFYEDWIAKFPNFAGINPQGRPYIKTLTLESTLEDAKEKEIMNSYKIYVAANKWAGHDDLMNFDDYKEFFLSDQNKHSEE